MSADEIITELEKLSPEELERVDSHLHGLLHPSAETGRASWGVALLEVAGAAVDLPSDLAANHDHYLHGTPRR